METADDGRQRTGEWEMSAQIKALPAIAPVSLCLMIATCFLGGCRAAISGGPYRAVFVGPAGGKIDAECCVVCVRYECEIMVRPGSGPRRTGVADTCWACGKSPLTLRAPRKCLVHVLGLPGYIYEVKALYLAEGHKAKCADWEDWGGENQAPVQVEMRPLGPLDVGGHIGPFADWLGFLKKDASLHPACRILLHQQEAWERAWGQQQVRQAYYEHFVTEVAPHNPGYPERNEAQVIKARLFCQELRRILSDSEGPGAATRPHP